jgi:maltooligosyltrehalose synthase
MSVAGDWQDTQLPLPKGEWRNLFTDASANGAVAPRQLFGAFPVAMLMRG